MHIFTRTGFLLILLGSCLHRLVFDEECRGGYSRGWGFITENSVLFFFTGLNLRVPSWKYLQLCTCANTSTGKPNYCGIWGFYCVCAIVLDWLGDIAFLASPVVRHQMWTGNLIVLAFNITHAELFNGKATFQKQHTHAHTHSSLSCVGCIGCSVSLRLWSCVVSSFCC